MSTEKVLVSFLRRYRQLKLGRPFVPAALDLLHGTDVFSTSSADSWADRKGSTKWQERASRLHGYIADVGTLPPRMHFLRPAWVRLKLLPN